MRGTELLEHPVETYDTRQAFAPDSADQRTLQAILTGAGGVLLALALALAILLSPALSNPRADPRVLLVYALAIVGAPIFALTLAARATARDLTKVVVGDRKVELGYSRGAAVDLRWDARPLRASISHVLPPVPRSAGRPVGWVLYWKDGSSRIGTTVVVTLEAGDAIVRRARSLGLETSYVRKELPTHGGVAVLERTKIDGV